MNSATIELFGSKAFSAFSAPDKFEGGIAPSAFHLFDASWPGKGWGRYFKPLDITEDTRHPAITGEVRGIQWLKRIGIAESVREAAVESAAFLPVGLRRTIEELASLRENWDGEGAKAVKPHVLADVVETLRRLSRQQIFREPFLAPTFNGFLQLEWHDERRWLDLEATPRGWSAVGTSIGSDGKRYYYTAEFDRSDFGHVEMFYHWLLSDELLTWPSL